MIKVLSNDNFTIRKIETRYTQTLYRILIGPYVPEQRMPDVRLNEYLPEPDVKTPRNDCYATSLEMNFLFNSVRLLRQNQRILMHRRV